MELRVSSRSVPRRRCFFFFLFSFFAPMIGAGGVHVAMLDRSPWGNILQSRLHLTTRRIAKKRYGLTAHSGAAPHHILPLRPWPRWANTAVARTPTTRKCMAVFCRPLFDDGGGRCILGKRRYRQEGRENIKKVFFFLSCQAQQGLSEEEDNALVSRWQQRCRRWDMLFVDCPSSHLCCTDVCLSGPV